MPTKIVDSTALDSALSAVESFVMKKSSDLPLIFHGTLASKPAVATQSAANNFEIHFCTADHRFYAKIGKTYYSNWPGRDLYQHSTTGNAYRKLYYKSTTNGYELYTIDSAGVLVKIPSDYYNKTEVDTKLAAKANTADVYNKTTADSTFMKTANYPIMTEAEAIALVNELFA